MASDQQSLLPRRLLLVEDDGLTASSNVIDGCGRLLVPAVFPLRTM